MNSSMISVSEMAQKLGVEIKAGLDGADNNVEGMYICDLLSWVMGNAGENTAWVTIQGHINIIAVAMLAGAACIILAEGSEPDEDTMNRADSEGIPVLTTKLTAYEIAVKFYILTAG